MNSLKKEDWLRWVLSLRDYGFDRFFPTSFIVIVSIALIAVAFLLSESKAWLETLSGSFAFAFFMASLLARFASIETNGLRNKLKDAAANASL